METTLQVVDPDPQVVEPSTQADEPSKPLPGVVALSTCPGTTPGTPLSKNQLKKQRKLAAYVELRKLRREKERERNKQKRRDAKEQGLPIRTGPSRKELKRKQAVTGADGNPALKVAIDLDYDELMQERDIAKCVKQCLRIYTINRRSSHPGELHFAGIRENGNIHKWFMKNDGWENWNVKYHFDKTHKDLFDREHMVYLTCESEQVLDKLQPGCTYIIGGLVDHNHFKGLCHQRATEAGLKTARLPLSEHVDMKTRSVLSTYHVFELLTKVAAGQDWTTAILDTIPVRKGAKAKDRTEDSEPKQPDEAEPQDIESQPPPSGLDS
ncbi:tRNA methyltransferase 10 homolog A [Drosophila bipectinata]|uniref:tRNA methyltransferase 10 homolog A n=1 Tax=Drosophila bipectinata TaxID=42026 RepID=UPI001C8A7A37|nr:tRNA methyltransferase 10 homolog A [Drosophila bipectinata]